MKTSRLPTRSSPSYLKMFLIFILVCILFYLINKIYNKQQEQKKQQEQVRQDEMRTKQQAQNNSLTGINTITLAPLSGPSLPPSSPSATPTPTVGVFNPPAFDTDCEKVNCGSAQKEVVQHYDVLRILATNILGKADSNNNSLCFKNQKSFVNNNRYQIAQREKNINIIANEAIMKSIVEGKFENVARLYLLINKIIANDGRADNQFNYVFTAYNKEGVEVSRMDIAKGAPIEYVTIKRGLSDDNLKVSELGVYDMPSDETATIPKKDGQLTEEYSIFKKYVLGKGLNNSNKTLIEELNDLKSKNPNETKIPLGFFGRYAVYVYNNMPGSNPPITGRRGIMKTNVEKKVKYDHVKLANDSKNEYLNQLLSEFKSKGLATDENSLRALLKKNEELNDYAICS